MKNQNLSKLLPQSFLNQILFNKNKEFSIILEIDIPEIEFVFKKSEKNNILILTLDKQKYELSEQSVIKKSKDIINFVKTKLEEIGINKIDFIEKIGQMYIEADYYKIVKINDIKEIKSITELI